MAKFPKDRSSMEANENLATKKVDAPEERFQTEQQVNPTVEMGSNSVDTEGFIPKKTKSSGHTLRQEVAAQVIKGKGAPGSSAGVASPATFGLREISFSGDTGTILGSASGTPSMGASYQGKSRVDKRLSDANKDINFNASEQVLNEYDNIPPLAASESTVGYNGNPKNVAARSQKRSGFTSAEMLFDRSLDFIEKDAAVFVTGQVVQQSGVNYESYPTKRVDIDPTSDTYGQSIEFGKDKQPVRGNYMPRNLKVTLSKTDGGIAYVSGFEVEEDDISTNNERDQVVNSSATNHKIDVNRAELARQTIDADAGSPTAEHFNPLGRSVEQPTATVTYLQDLENATGATVFAAYKYANKARGHYLNRTAKDGQYITEPAIDALYGHLYGANSYASLIASMGGTEANAPLFKKSANAKGSAATLIYAFDSVGKYKTKGDLVNQPRGLKMHIQTADNNMDPFHCKSEFVAALNSIDAYSTIDHEYDPLSPVYITDNVRLIYPYSWARALKFKRTDPYTKIYESEVPSYYYSAGSGLNSYMVLMGEPVLNGVAYFLDQHAAGLLEAIGGVSGTVLNIPICHSTTHFSLWDLLVCASTPYIIYERTNTMKDILDYEMFYKYPFQGTVRIADAQPTNAVNYGNPSTLEPLTVKQMLPSSALRWKYPEAWARTTAGLIAPFYFNERSYDFITEGKTSTLKYNGECNFTTPVVRSGMKLSGLDDFFGVDVKDNLLIHDGMTRLPGLDVSNAFSGCVYKYSNDADGLVVIRESALTNKTAIDWLATPRLLGWYMDLPYRLGQVAGSDSQIPAAANVTLASVAPSFRAVLYKGALSAGVSQPNTILAPGTVNIGRAQAFKQDWYIARAGSASDKADDFDLIMSLGEGFTTAVEGGVRTFISSDKVSQFMPFMMGEYSVSDGDTEYAAENLYREGTDSKPAIFALHRVLWALLQKTCFIINPFDNATGSNSYVDPFTIPYVFGLAGFMAANYDEEIFNRINEVQHQGYGYTHDPMTSSSIVFKDAYKHTQIG